MIVFVLLFRKWSIWLNKEEDDETKVEQAKGWGGIFAQSKGKWKCPSCFIQNNYEDKKCVACEAIRPPAIKLPTSPKNPFASIKIVSSSSSKALVSGFAFGSAPSSAFTFGSTSEKKDVSTSSVFTFGNTPEKKDGAAPSSAFAFGSASEKRDVTATTSETNDNNNSLFASITNKKPSRKDQDIINKYRNSVKNLKYLFQHGKEDAYIDEGNSDSLSKKKVVLSSVQAKKQMFEKMSIKNPTLKKTWKARGNGMYEKQMRDTRGVAPKKSLNDLP